MTAFNPEEITRLIRSRRSVFPAQYSGETIKKELIEEILENANWAPTHKLTQPWRFSIFTGKGLQVLGDYMAKTYKDESELKGDFDQALHARLKKKPSLASHVISIGMKRDAQERLPEIEEIEAVACAVQNMYLTATAHGIGSYWGTGGITYMEKAKPFFKLGEKDKLLGFMFLGIPEKPLHQGRRDPVEDKVEWIEN